MGCWLFPVDPFILHLPLLCSVLQEALKILPVLPRFLTYIRLGPWEALAGDWRQEARGWNISSWLPSCSGIASWTPVVPADYSSYDFPSNLHSLCFLAPSPPVQHWGYGQLPFLLVSYGFS